MGRMLFRPLLPVLIFPCGIKGEGVQESSVITAGSQLHGCGSQVDMERREKSAIVESLGIFKFAKSAKSFLCHWVSAANGKRRRREVFVCV